jgi:hypothetical protein
MGGGAATGANLGGNTGNGLEGGEDGDKNGFVFQLPGTLLLSQLNEGVVGEGSGSFL